MKTGAPSTSKAAGATKSDIIKEDVEGYKKNIKSKDTVVAGTVYQREEINEII